MEKIEGYFSSRLDELLTCKTATATKTRKFKGFIERDVPNNRKIDRLRDVVTINDKALSSNTNADFTFKYVDIQDEIIANLDKLLGKLNKTLTTVKSQIETLKAYRKSLIHECVTGKKQVYEGDYAEARTK